MKFILTFSLCAFCLASWAQEDKRPWMPLENRIGLAIGIGTHTFIDPNTSPLIYQSKPKNLRVFYQLESNCWLMSLDLDLRIGSLAPLHHRDRMLVFEEEDYKGEKETKRFPAGGSFMAGKISLGAFHKIKSTQESTFKVAAGIRVSNELFYPQGWTSAGLMNALTIAPAAISQHRFDEHHKLTAAFSLPLLARVTRLPYHNSVSYPGENQLGGFFRNTTWLGITKYIAPQLSLGYDYQINQRWGTGLAYDFTFYQVKTEQRFRAMSQSLRASFYHQF